MRQAITIGGVVFLALALAACVAGSGESAHAAGSGLLSQFLLGFWHGLIGPLMMIVEVINKLAPHLLPWDVHFYETKASGAAYDVGFYIGLVGSPLLAGSRWRGRA